MYFAEHEREIYGNKPEIAAHTVEYTAQTRILLGHSSQLAVGAIKRIGPHQQQHTHYVEPHHLGLIEIEQHTACHA